MIKITHLLAGKFLIDRVQIKIRINLDY